MYIRDKFMRGGRNYLSPFDASEGTLYLIFVAALLANLETPNTFALDNVDGTLNPKLVRTLTSHIVQVCTKHNDPRPRQIFMTSHHPSALDSFDIFDENHRIFIANRINDAEARNTSAALGSTKFRQFKPPRGRSKDEWMVAHGGKNLSELLLENRIKDAL
jgi:predicted ATPase